MNKWVQRNPDHPLYVKPKSKPVDNDSGAHDSELSDAADDIHSVATAHRKGVIAKDKAAKARRKAGRRG